MPAASPEAPEEEVVETAAAEPEELQLEPADDVSIAPETAAAPEVPEAAPEEPEPSFLDVMAEHGLSDLARMKDEQAAFNELVNRARVSNQNEELARWGQYYLQNQQQFQQAQQAAQQYQQYIAQQQAAQRQWAAQQQAQQNAWKAPEFHPDWLRMVEEVKDPATGEPTGELRARPGADPLLPSKIEAYAQWKREQEAQFYANPYEFVWKGLAPQVNNIVEQRTQAAIQQAMQGLQQQWAAQQAQQQAQALIQNNLSWLVEHNSEGQPLRNAAGGYIPTAEGKRFNELVSHAHRLGIASDQAQWDYATAQLRAELAQAVLQQQLSQAGQATAQQPAADPRAAAQQEQANKNMEFLKKNRNQASRSGNRTGSVPKPGQPAPVQNAKLSFRDQLRQNAEMAGLTDDDIDEEFVKNFVA